MGEICARLQARFPQARICCVEGVLRAWIPDGPDELTGYGEHGYGEQELAAKLAAAG